MASPSTYWKKQLKQEGQDLASFSAELKTLTDEDKRDLDHWSEDEMRVKGIPVG